VSVSAWLADAAGHRIRNHFLGQAVAAALSERPDLDAEALHELAAKARAAAIVVSPAS